jgi:hypothetical protein
MLFFFFGFDPTSNGPMPPQKLIGLPTASRLVAINGVEIDDE